MKISRGQLVIATLALLVILIQSTWMLRTRQAGQPALLSSPETNIPNDSLHARAPDLAVPPPSKGGPANQLEPAAPVEEIVGIGAMLRFDRERGALIIQGTVPNSPAAEAGLTRGLIVNRIDDTFTKGMRLEQCVELVRGAPGTAVRLELVDPQENETNQIELVRKKVVVTPSTSGPNRLELQN